MILWEFAIPPGTQKGGDMLLARMAFVASGPITICVLFIGAGLIADSFG